MPPDPIRRLDARALALAAALFAAGLLSEGRARAEGPEACLVCHANEQAVGAAGRAGLLLDREEVEKSVHSESGIGCTDCHTDLASVKGYPHKTGLSPVDCSMCHSEVAAAYAQSIHGERSHAGDKSVARCKDCHGTHGIRKKADPGSTTYPLTIAGTCEKCHADRKIAQDHHMNEALSGQYDRSVHGRAVAQAGLVSAAVCTSCHGAHDIQKGADPRSRVARANIPKTCGACHVGIYQGYIESVHGKDYLKGIKDVPVCTDCHGEHTIGAHGDPDSSVFSTHIGRVCAKCHENEKIAREYSMQPDRLKSFLGTYHGVASSYGDVKVANCASCHGFHDVRPANDPKSLIHPANLPRTCGKCHPNAGENFAKGKVHVTNPKEHNLWQFVVQKTYTILITMVIGGFVVFIVVDLFARVLRKRRAAGRKAEGKLSSRPEREPSETP